MALEAQDGRRSPIALLIVFVLMLTAVGLCLFSVNRKDNVGTDPLGQMLVSENLLRHHSLSLDNLDDQTLKSLNYHVVCENNGHNYYYFPFGTTLLATPVVAVLDAAGWNMTKDDAAAQAIGCAIIAVVLIALMYGIARRLLPPLPAAILTGLMWLGTSLASVGGLALWAHSTSTMFAMLAIWLVTRDPAVRSPLLRVALGLALFMAYLCRPTMSLLSPMMLLFVACYSWRSAFWVGAVVAALLGAFFAFNLHVFGEALPLFYAGDRLGTPTYLEGIYGNLVGASRGILVFSPFLIVPILLVPRILRSDRRLLLILGLAWPIAHLLVVASFPRWWAGYSFGPRYTMEVLPGLFVLLCLGWSVVRERPLSMAVASALAFTGAAAIFVNVVEGMNNPAAWAWNSAVRTDENPNLALDWRFPQWMATARGNEEIAAYVAHLHPSPGLPSPVPPALPMVAKPSLIDFGGYRPAVEFLGQGWGTPESWGVWSNAEKPQVRFRVASSDLRTIDIEVFPLVNALRPTQTINLSVNGCELASQTYSDTSTGRAFIGGTVPIACLKTDNVMDVELSTDRLVTPASLGMKDDVRQIGIGIKRLIVQRAGQEDSRFFTCRTTPVF